MMACSLKQQFLTCSDRVETAVSEGLCERGSVCVPVCVCVCVCVWYCLCIRLVSSCHDETSQFMRLIAKPGRQFIEFDDFLPLIQV